MVIVAMCLIFVRRKVISPHNRQWQRKTVPGKREKGAKGGLFGQDFVPTRNTALLMLYSNESAAKNTPTDTQTTTRTHHHTQPPPDTQPHPQASAPLPNRSNPTPSGPPLPPSPPPPPSAPP